MPNINFVLFSSDATGSPPDPDTATTKIILTIPKSFGDKGSNSIFTPPKGRGSKHETLESIVIQDFGVPSNQAGGSIYLEDDDVLDSTKKTALETAHEAVDTEWYFSDGISVYKVQFSRNPVGFHSWLNYAIYRVSGREVYSYEMQLIVVEKVS